jgi:arabinogalactan endo-1,4-beta-galactosidase
MQGLHVNSKRIVTAEAKQKALISSLAVKIAKQMGDPNYEKYKMYKQMATEMKKKILAKYAKAAIEALREKGVQLKVTAQDITQK